MIPCTFEILQGDTVIRGGYGTVIIIRVYTAIVVGMNSQVILLQKFDMKYLLR